LQLPVTSNLHHAALISSRHPPANTSIIKLDIFKGLNKKQQKRELARVNKKFRKRYAITGNKTNNELVYKQCLKENTGLEVNALEPDTLINTDSFTVRKA
jgi:hypothetical protein